MNLLERKGILNSKRYKAQLHYTFFCTGQGHLSGFRLQYIILGVIIASGIGEGLISIIIYGICSYLLGRLWYKRIKGVSQVEIQAEVANQFNKFQQEMRETYKKQ